MTPPLVSSRRAGSTVLWSVVAVVVLFTAGELWRLIVPASAPFVPRHDEGLADALARDDVRRAYDLLRTERPEEPIVVSDATLTGGASMRVAPMAWAVARGADKSVRMLAAFGATLEATGPVPYVCLAEVLGKNEVAAILEALRPASTPCPRQRGDLPPLLPFAQP